MSRRSLFSSGEVPLASDGSARFLAWLNGLMVFLAALAIAAAACLGSGVARWDAGLAGSLTVQLPRPADGTPLAPDSVQRAVALLLATPGVLKAAPLAADAEAGLLKPWLGDLDPAVLPVPLLIDVHVDPAATLDIAALTRKLGAIVAGAAVATHDRWLGRMIHAARLVVLTSYAILGLVAGTASLTVIFATRTGLQVHREVIELLHLIGAGDAYIARQFQFHAFLLGLGGGIGGLAAALAFFAALAAGMNSDGSGTEAPIFAGLAMPVVACVAIPLLPLVTGLLGLAVARVTVLRELGRRP